MHFSKLSAILSTVALTNAIPVANNESPTQICKTIGVLNLLDCVSALNNLDIDLDVLKERDALRGGGSGTNQKSPEQVCETLGALNILNCVSALNDLGLNLDILKERDTEPWNDSDSGSDSGQDSPEQVCETIGVVNILDCVSALNNLGIDVDVLRERDALPGGGSDGSSTKNPEKVCKTIGAVNVLNCVSILNNLGIDLSLLSGLVKERDALPGGGSGSSQNSPEQVCETIGVVNVLNCVSALNNLGITVDLLGGVIKISASSSNNNPEQVCKTIGAVNVGNCVSVLNNLNLNIKIGRDIEDANEKRNGWSDWSDNSPPPPVTPTTTTQAPKPTTTTTTPAHKTTTTTPAPETPTQPPSQPWTDNNGGSGSGSGGGSGEECTTDGLGNILNCVNLGNGGKVKVGLLGGLFG